ncbi:MAG: putative aminohydrolase SsnA [Oligoflexia bacterium]|nr:putative aminohydrolase SsnA [Oligoflexia bacterium]
MTKKNKLVIKGGIIATLGEENKILRKHALIIDTQRGIIEGIVPEEKIEEAIQKIIDVTDTAEVQVINAAGKVVMPGFINAHMHFYSSFACGLTKAKSSKNFMEVLENLWWRLDKKLALDDCYYSTALALIAAIKKGTTTIIDHHASPFAVRGSLLKVAEAVQALGLRASLCYELSDRDGAEIASAGIEENLEFIKWVIASNRNDLKALFGMHASFTIEAKTMRRAVERVRALSSQSSHLSQSAAPVGFHIHCAEDLADQEITIKKYSQRVVERLYQEQVLGRHTICAHAVHLNERERELLAETDTVVIHNPQSNMNNAVGVADILKMSEKGVCVGLGTDAMTVNMLEELRSAIWVQRLHNRHPNVAFVEAASLLIKNNPRIASRYWGTIGELVAGAFADIILMDYYPPTELNADNFLGHLVFGLAESTVDTTIVNGKILMQNKQLVGIDEERIAARSLELSRKLWERF